MSEKSDLINTVFLVMALISFVCVTFNKQQ